MLHTGTMFAVIVYFWKAWRRTFFASWADSRRVALLLSFATVLTAAVGYPIKTAIEKIALRSVVNADVEMIFGNLLLVSVALAAVGLLILYAGLRRSSRAPAKVTLTWREAGWMGAVQGLCLPFRGFSRSGATISTGLVLGAKRSSVEEFSFALAVILTPPVVLREVKRLLESRADRALGGGVWHLFVPGLLGMVASFLAGLLALAWLSRWLERGKWQYFGIYCLLAAGGVFAMRLAGF
jgi:undecaprenyl-diphosphatase